MTSHSHQDVYNQGYQDQLCGVTRFECPYATTDSRFVYWFRGWSAANECKTRK